MFDKTYTCPVCDHEFKSKMVRTGKAKLVSADTDLRPKYQGIDPLKYDAILCPKCGYASLNRYFNFVMSSQAKMIREKISATYHYVPEGEKVYTYEEAITRHKMALLNTIVKHGKTSERAYTCLKIAWLFRGKREEMMQGDYKKEEVVALLAEEKVSVVTTGAGNPSKYMELWNNAGIHVIPVVASTALAKLVERLGASAVIAEGGESGGHVGDATTMALVPQVCDAVNIPVIAAGGIADGRTMAAAFMLGAQGVQIGTRFLVAEECGVHQNYKNKILHAGDISTIVTGRRLGHPVRSIKTPFSRAYAKAEYTDISDDDLEQMAVGALRLAAVEGDEKNGCFLAGQIAGLVNREQPAKEIIEEICTEAENILKGASKWVKQQ